MFNNIYLLGAGAIGGLIAGSLSEKFPERVFVYDKDVQHTKKISEDGIDFEIKANGRYERFNSKPRMINKSEFSPSSDDLVIIALKQYSMHEVIDKLQKVTCPILLLQNGYNPLSEKINGKTIYGVIEFAASFIMPGHVKQTTSGKIYLGANNGLVGKVGGLSEELSTEKLSFESRLDIGGYFWSKLILNSAMNPVTALIGQGYETVFADPEARELAIRTYIESYNVARKYSRNLPKSMGFSPDRAIQFLRFPFLKNSLFFVSKKFRDVESSMLQDIRRNRPTEIDYINGYLVRKAEEKGIDARTNRKIISLIHDIESGVLKPNLDNVRLI